MKNHLLFTLLTTIFCTFSGASLGKSLPESAAFKTVAYQKFNTMSNFEAKVYQHIDQLIYKLIRVNAQGGLELLPSTIADLDLLRANQTASNKVKLLMGIGGAKRNSQHFSAMAGSAKTRSHFVRNLIVFCHKYQLDGADIDWEYPETPQDKYNALLLFKQLQQSFNQEKLFLSAAITYSPEQVRFAKQVEPYVHQINLMVYEPLKGLKTFQQQVDFAIELIEKEQLSSEKLVVGLPFYGRHIKTGKTTAYNKIMKKKQLASSDISQINYMGADEIKANTQMLKAKGYAGVMFWELGFDTPINSNTSLLRAIHSHEP